MLYRLAHLLKERFPFLWDSIENVNSWLFFLMNRKKLRQIPKVLQKWSVSYELREVTLDDVAELVSFFNKQPHDAFKFFHSHGFDESSILKVINNKAFLTFVVLHEQKIIGYFFLRCYLNGKGFRGRIVDNSWNNKGIGKMMSLVLSQVAETLGVRLFSSISPQNYASLASIKATTHFKIIKTLPNGYYYIEILPKK